MMIDLHMHTLFSDGELIPAELLRRAEAAGYEAFAITDHVDNSNYDFVVPRLVMAAQELGEFTNLTIIPGAEITHVPPELIGDLASKIRTLGAKIIVVHGETIAEPVAKGTNKSAVNADIDIIAHPGLIDDETCEIAKKKGIHLEITVRKGHSLTNGHVASMAKKHGVHLVLNSDTHQCTDLLSKEYATRVLLGAGIEPTQIESVFNNSKVIANRFR
ncbi:histidinol phosphate phosphatase domain-containing protein [Thermodesulfobacteriota bacterium]